MHSGIYAISPLNHELKISYRYEASALVEIYLQQPMVFETFMMLLRRLQKDLFSFVIINNHATNHFVFLFHSR